MGNCSTPTHTVARQPGREESAGLKEKKKKKKTIKVRIACGARKIVTLPGRETALQRKAPGNALRPADALFCQRCDGSAAGRSASQACLAAPKAAGLGGQGVEWAGAPFSMGAAVERQREDGLWCCTVRPTKKKKCGSSGSVPG